MPLSHFPYGVSSFGCPVMPTFPFSGDSRYYYVDVVNGNDGNAGTDPSQAYKTIAQAYSVLRSGHYDTVFAIGLGTAFTLSAALVWSKTYTNLIGLCAPTMVGQRCRITSGTATITPMVTFSGDGISVWNLQLAQFGNSATGAAVTALVSGQRQYYNNVHFASNSNSTARGNAALRALVLSGAQESTFDGCMIGRDDADTSAASYELGCTAQATRVLFRKCKFIKRATTATGGFLVAPASSLDRWLEFDDCTFENFTGGGGTTLTSATLIDAACGGDVIIKNCLLRGATDWSAATSVNLWADNQPSAATVGLAQNPTT